MTGIPTSLVEQAPVQGIVFQRSSNAPKGFFKFFVVVLCLLVMLFMAVLAFSPATYGFSKSTADTVSWYSAVGGSAFAISLVMSILLIFG